MKLSTAILCAIAVILMACGEPRADVFDPTVSHIPNSLGSKVHIVPMADGTTCYVVNRDGSNSISCIRKAGDGK